MSRFLKSSPRNDQQPSQAEIRRAKDFWTDVFEGAILAQVDESSTSHGAPVDIVNFASEVARLALEEMEKRWPKI